MDIQQWLKMLNRFFETQIGNTLMRSKMLDDPYTEPFGGSVRRVFGKRFLATVVAVTNNKLLVSLSAERLSQSGDLVDNRKEEFGDLTIDLKKVGGLEDFWMTAIEKVDPMFNEACCEKT